MSRIIPLICALVFFFGVMTETRAQVLGDDFIENSTDDDEMLFDEIFSDYSETDKDINKVKTFDDAVSQAAKEIKKTGVTETPLKDVEIKPVSGEMLIGIQKGSFKTFTDLTGRKKCTFKAVLESHLDRGIRTVALNLIYPKRVFAFVFRDILPQDKQLQSITTSGDICYNLGGVPDIDIHVCKIKGTLGADCAKLLKWSDDLK